MTYYRVSFLIVPVAAIASKDWIDLIAICALTTLFAMILDYREGRLR